MLAPYATPIATALAVILMAAVGIAGRGFLSDTPRRELTYLVLLILISNVVVYHRLYDFVTLIVPLFWVVTYYHTIPKPISGVLIALFALLNYLHPIVEWASTTGLIPASLFALHLYALVALYYGAILLLFREWNYHPVTLSTHK